MITTYNTIQDVATNKKHYIKYIVATLLVLATILATTITLTNNRMTTSNAAETINNPSEIVIKDSETIPVYTFSIKVTTGDTLFVTFNFFYEGGTRGNKYLTSVSYDLDSGHLSQFDGFQFKIYSDNDPIVIDRFAPNQKTYSQILADPYSWSNNGCIGDLSSLNDNITYNFEFSVICTDSDMDYYLTLSGFNDNVYKTKLRFEYSPEIQLPTNPQIEGYTFNGWYYDNNYTQLYNGNSISSDTILYASFSVNYYTVYVDYNGGLMSGELEYWYSYTIEDYVYLHIPYREKYIFKGFYTNPQFTGESITTINKGTTGDINLYTKWEYNWVMVTFNVGDEKYIEFEVERGSVLINNTQVQFLLNMFDIPIEYLTTPINESVVINTSESTSYISSQNVDISKNITMHFMYVQNFQSYYEEMVNINLNINNNVLTFVDTTPSIIFDYFNNLVLTIKDEFNNIVKIIESGVYPSINFNDIGLENGTTYDFYVSFEFEKVSDNAFVFYDDDLLIPFTYYHIVELPTAIEIDGYTFVGWYYDEELTAPYTNAPIFENTDLYAKYELITYTVNFVSNNGVELTALTYTILDTIELTSPTREGYTFKGWFTNEQFTGTPLLTIEVGTFENLTLYAKWQITTYNVNIYINGNLYKTLEVEWGTVLQDNQSIQQLSDVLVFDTELFATPITDDISILSTTEKDSFLSKYLDFGIWLQDNYIYVLIGLAVVLFGTTFIVVKVKRG